MKAARLKLMLDVVLKGHILNAPWNNRLKRRRIRGIATQKAVCKYLAPYAQAVSALPEDGVSSCGELPENGAGEERIFSIWLQGEENAPEVVKACLRSIRKNCPQELVLLDAESIFKWISLPEHIVEKWRSGKMRPAHFADICRVELLYRYGGLWLDATDFVAHPIPEDILKQDFFVYMSGDRQRGFYSYIQNCFIRARKGSYLLKCWREAMFGYWAKEDSTVDYFVHQLLFKCVVESNARAGELFSEMPKLGQDPTHLLWFEHGSEAFDPDGFERMVSAAAFQKTEYKSELAKNPAPGSYAEAVINMYR